LLRSLSYNFTVNLNKVKVMESLAYLELALVSETPAQLPIVTRPKCSNLSSQTYIRWLSLALILSVLSAASSAVAQIDPGNPNPRSVQDRLQDLGYFPRTSTGQLGRVTQQALTNFQQDYGLSVTGRLDRDTAIALNDTVARGDRSFRTVYANYEDLRFGDRGAGVLALQRRLKHLGYFHTHPTGSFREITLHAVKAFQRANGLRVTGVADRQTLALLFRSIPPHRPIPLPDGDVSGNGGCKGLRFGDRGATVDLIQRQLKALGYFEGHVDGKFRERTLYAVTRFQQDYGLVSDGCADTATLNAIDAQMRDYRATFPAPRNSDNYAGEFLGLGDRGRQVELLQRRLQDLGYYRGSINGRFDRATESALIDFQEDIGLSGTGRVDHSTRSALWQASRQTAQISSVEDLALQRGARGHAVRQLQSRLRSQGRNPGPINGIFGSETEFAVLRFQEERNLPATGIATAETLAALENPESRSSRVPALPINRNFNSRSSVQQLQRRLRELRFYNGPVNGIFDSATQAALTRAQRAYGVSGDDLLSRNF
jgi:peptidoglycan hydrolase-like protein with peptidoglycan-binding domain